VHARFATLITPSVVSIRMPHDREMSARGGNQHPIEYLLAIGFYQLLPWALQTEISLVFTSNRVRGTSLDTLLQRKNGKHPLFIDVFILLHTSKMQQHVLVAIHEEAM
jgi:hypothetical protein